MEIGKASTKSKPIENKSDRTVIKTRMEYIIKNIETTQKLNTIINNTNSIINIAQLFMRSFILYNIEQKIQWKGINEDFIRMSFAAISCTINDDQENDKPENDESENDEPENDEPENDKPENKNNKRKGRKFNDDKQEQLAILNNFFDKFSSDTGIKRINISNISFILSQSCKQINISIINNIKYHYDKHLWKYIKASFIDEYNTIKETKNRKLKEYYSELNKVKEDIYNNTENCDIKYHEWIKNNRTNIIPNTYSKKKFDSDIVNNTFEYLKCMHFMTSFVQTKEIKSYQIFPIMTSSYNNYIKINTSALIDIFYDQYKEIDNEYICPDNCETCKGNHSCIGYKAKTYYIPKSGDEQFQNFVWNKVFNLKNKNGVYKYKRKGFTFNYEMETDGFGVSLNMINNNKLEEKRLKKKNFRIARQETAKNKKNLSDAEYKAFIKDKNEKKKIKEENDRLLKKENSAKKKEEYKNKTENEKEKEKNEMNEKAKFPYIERILTTKTKRKEFEKLYENGQLVLIDPGKRSLLYMKASNNIIHKPEHKYSFNNFGVSIWKQNSTGKEHKIMNYTNGTRLMALKRKKYSKQIEEWKLQLNSVPENANEWDKKSLKDIERELSGLNSKSCNYNDFIKYIIKRMEYLKKIKNQYNTDLLHKLRWYSYLNKVHHENMLMKHIKNEFGDNITIIIGDWSNKGKVNFMSTSNIGLKRKLVEHFKVYLINEYNTSKIHYEHRKSCENMEVKIKVNKTNNRRYRKPRKHKKGRKKHKYYSKKKKYRECNM